MNKLFLFICFLISAQVSFSQSGKEPEKVKMPDFSNQEKVYYTKAEVPPKFKNGIESFKDSIKAILLQTVPTYKKGTLLMTIYLNKEATVDDIKTISTSAEIAEMSEVIKKYISSKSDIWTPAKQNNREVSFLERIKIEFTKKDIIVSDNNTY